MMARWLRSAGCCRFRARRRRAVRVGARKRPDRGVVAGVGARQM